jgi:P27 family predicted phage terminase small subunit
MAGRKPLPTNLKVLKGTQRKGRTNKAEPRPEQEGPSPPEHLSRYALMEGGRITPQLHALGLLSQLDRSTLAAYCQCYGRWKEAEEQLKTTGFLIRTTNGNVVQNPLLGIANRALDLMNKYATMFGLSPSERSRIRVDDQGKVADASQWGQFGV